MTYNPEIWLESTIREIKSYVTSHPLFNTRIYNLVMEFPGSIVDSLKMPMEKTIIHFEVDEIRSMPVGMGDGQFADNYDPITSDISPQYAMVNRINFDVGIWSSDKSGGTTSRMRARQILQNLFNPGAVEPFRNLTNGGDGGIEILEFSGGRFVLDSANDVRLYRMVDGSLDVRVYSRTPIPTDPTGTAIEEIIQSPGLTILG